MNITTNELTGKNSELLTTEIKFFIAAAKAVGNDLIQLKIKRLGDDEREARRMNTITRILKSVKRQGLIQLFIISTEINAQTTESAYLKNKYPELASYICGDDISYVLKL